MKPERELSRVVYIAALALLLPLTANCQTSRDPLPDAPQPQADTKQVTLRDSPRNILHDQAAIWTSPARIRDSNALVPVLLVVATAGAITADHQVMSTVVSQDASLNNHAVTASNGLVGGFIALPVAMYGLGHIRRDDHATETGILGGEAIVDSLVVNEVLKLVSERERPTVDNAKGKFFQSGVGFSSAFPSNHSVIAWSSAAIIASEYDGTLTQLTAYSLATGVSLTRVLGRQHFPSDVVVGSAVGWLVGRYVFHKHARFLDSE